MIVYWVAAAELLFYLSAVPLRMAFYLRAGNELRFGAGVGAFERRFARRRAWSHLMSPQTRRSGKWRPKARHIPALFHLAWQFIRHLHIDQLSLQGRLSLGDAANTALLCGGLQALESALRPVCPQVHLSVHPAFNADAVHLELQGMISARSGQIMFAAVISVLDYANGRITQWIDTRLKAS